MIYANCRRVVPAVGQDATIVDRKFEVEHENETGDTSAIKELLEGESEVEQIGEWELIEKEEEKWVWFNSHYFSPKKGMYASVRFDKIEDKWVLEIMSEGSIHFEPYKHFHTLIDAFDFAIGWMRGRVGHCTKSVI